MSVNVDSNISNGIVRNITGRKGTFMTCENHSGSAIETDSSSSVILNALPAVTLQGLVMKCVQQG